MAKHSELFKKIERTNREMANWNRRAILSRKTK